MTTGPAGQVSWNVRFTVQYPSAMPDYAPKLSSPRKGDCALRQGGRRMPVFTPWPSPLIRAPSHRWVASGGQDRRERALDRCGRGPLSRFWKSQPAARTATGTSKLVVVPLPSWPSPL